MSEPTTDADVRRAFIYRVLSRLVLRVTAQSEGRHPRSYSEQEKNAILATHDQGLVHDVGQLAEIMEQARRAGIAKVHTVFTKIDNIDPTLMAQAIDAATNEEGETE